MEWTIWLELTTADVTVSSQLTETVSTGVKLDSSEMLEHQHQTQLQNKQHKPERSTLIMVGNSSLSVALA